MIQTALKQWNLELIPYKRQSELAKLAREHPTQMQAYICNFKQHWYTIRKIGKYWFNLNSMFRGPELISDTYLAVLLKQLETDGYSIFIVDGELPKSEADRHLNEIELNTREILNRQVQGRATSSSVTNEGFDDDELKRAIKMSLIENDKGLDADSTNKNFSQIVYEEQGQDDDGELERAIAMSLEAGENEPTSSSKESDTSSPSGKPKEKSVDEIRRKRLEYLDKMNKSKESDQ